MAMSLDSVPAEEAREKIADVAALVGREVRVFLRDAAVPSAAAPQGSPPAADVAKASDETPSAAAKDADAGKGPRLPEDEEDSFYEFTIADYARVSSGFKQEVGFKTRAVREQELQEKRNRITKAIIRVQFPQGLVLEASFSPSDSVADVRTWIRRCLLNPDTPFLFFTAPPKSHIKDESVDLYTASLAPGALIYFEPQLHDKEVKEQPQPQGDSAWVKGEVVGLRDVHKVLEMEATRYEVLSDAQVVAEQASKQKPVPGTPHATAEKKKGVPKWFKK